MPTRSQPFFLNEQDEARFSATLVQDDETVCFIDGSRWGTAEPVVRKSILECLEGYVYIWSRAKFPTFPVGPAVAVGKFDGPTSGCVIQYMRSRMKGGVLYSGQMGAGWTQGIMEDYSALVFKRLRQMRSAVLRCIDPRSREVKSTGVKNYVVGPGAAEASRSGTQLWHVTAEVYYQVE